MAYAITSQFHRTQKAAIPAGVTVGALAATAVLIGIIGLITGKFLLGQGRSMTLPLAASATLVALGGADILAELVAAVYKRVKNPPLVMGGWATAPDGLCRPYLKDLVNPDGSHVFDYSKDPK